MIVQPLPQDIPLSRYLFPFPSLGKKCQGGREDFVGGVMGGFWKIVA